LKIGRIENRVSPIRARQPRGCRALQAELPDQRARVLRGFGV
jgi:hypothetical protein